MKNTIDLIEHFKEQLKLNSELPHPEPKDVASWPDQIGMIITWNDVDTIMRALIRGNSDRRKIESKDITYRNYTISTGGLGYTYVHDEYDGAPDSGDNRNGSCQTIQQCIDEINEQEDES